MRSAGDDHCGRGVVGASVGLRGQQLGVEERPPEALRQVTSGVGNAVQGTVDNTLSKTDEALRKAREEGRRAARQEARLPAAGNRATATDPKTQPPTHGTDPHGQGGVAVVDVDPKSDRPLSSDPTGKDSGEDVIVGRARGEKVNDAYNGHITIAVAVRLGARRRQHRPGRDEERPAAEPADERAGPALHEHEPAGLPQRADRQLGDDGHRQHERLRGRSRLAARPRRRRRGEHRHTSARTRTARRRRARRRRRTSRQAPARSRRWPTPRRRRSPAAARRRRSRTPRR